MGNESSTNAFRDTPRIGEASLLYWSCRNGDVQVTRQILSTQDFSDMNQLEPNGSTALHAAAFFGHSQIVHLLLNEYGVIRHRKNRYELTAYQEASTNQIRQLFQRHGHNRFCSHDDVSSLFDMAAPANSQDHVPETKPSSGWVNIHRNMADSYLSCVNFQRKFLTNPLCQLPMKTACKVFFWQENAEKIMTRQLQAVIHSSIPTTHLEYRKARELFSQYAKEKKLEPLLRLYSLETPFYKSLNRDNSDALFMPLLWRLQSLESRTFQGQSFRGLTMTDEDLRAYQWALHNKNSLIRTCSFCSTSLEERVARQFIGPSIATDKKRVLMVFHFPELCDTAIALYRLSDNLPCVSEYEDEKEVLLLPRTMFMVTNIKQSVDLIIIYLENVNTFSALKFIKKELASE
ncbi:unnamed protein product [Adineta ricciae]|uniref:Uncharacterized protein n=1 Tax=Adineta ricciae TaxID=249248 RepID=A0A815NDY0_ADIRI|nr:unnamed protein product [Adineta ricciae]CAF1430668.1 unnamed protein product [Adineta ricciae]